MDFYKKDGENEELDTHSSIGHKEMQKIDSSETFHDKDLTDKLDLIDEDLDVSREIELVDEDF